MKLCFCDIDGVLASSQDRQVKAHEIAMQKLMSRPQDFSEFALPLENIPKLREMNAYKKAFYADDAFYSPDLMGLDTLLEGASKGLDKIEQAGYTVFFLTSRIERTRQATLAWLDANDLYIPLKASPYDNLIMKPTGFTFTKTLTWKTGIIQQYAALFKAQNVLVVDDELPLLETVKASELPCSVMVAASLKEAIEAVK